MPVRKLLKSKPVIIAGTATLANKLMQKTKSGRKRRRSKTVSLATTALLVGSAVAAIRWFTDPILGESRRRMIKGKVQPQSHNGQAPEITIPESEPTPTPNI